MLQADSRDYIIPFSVSGEADVPSDFALPREMPREFAGIFLPRDRALPPSVLLLAGPSIRVIARDGGAPKAIPLARLEVLECGRALLLGWIGLHWDGCSEILRYNRRAAAVVERFLRRLKAAWLQPAQSDDAAETFGPEPAVKFRNTLGMELLVNEAPGLQFFQPPTSKLVRWFGIPRQKHTAGDYLMLSERRFLWITDRRTSIRDPYGTVANSAALAAISEVRLSHGNGGLWMRIGLSSGTTWNIPVAGERTDDAEAFVNVFRKRMTR